MNVYFGDDNDFLPDGNNLIGVSIALSQLRLYGLTYTTLFYGQICFSTSSSNPGAAACEMLGVE
jgi:hypothetical protein